MIGLAHDWDLEVTVLANYLQSPDLRSAMERHVDTGDFTRPTHQECWRVMTRIQGEDGGLDVVTLMDAAENLTAADAGGPGFLARLAGSSAAFDEAVVLRECRRLREMTTRRRVAQAGHLMAEMAGDQLRPLDELRVRVDEILQVLYTADTEARGMLPLGVSARLEAEAAEKRMRGIVTDDIIPTGWRDLDKILEGGIRRTDLVILGARPAMGKSAVALSLLLNAAKTGRGAALFSLEMSRGQQAQRALANLAGVPLGSIRGGQGLMPSDVDQLYRNAERIHDLPIFVDDRVGVSVGYIRSQVRQLKRHLPELALIAVDYLQLVKGQRHRTDNRATEVGGISTGLKDMAREENVAIIALAQLNRGPDQRENHRPIPADLKESGSLEQDADLILFPYRDEVYNQDDPTLVGQMEIIVAKQRGGDLGTARVKWTGEFQRIEDAVGEREQGRPDRGSYY